MTGFPVISITEVSLFIIMIITQRENSSGSTRVDFGPTVIYYLYK